ncbi:hypothetical protein BH09MYX1_BH09MYX1_64670 [soil metagenome]
MLPVFVRSNSNLTDEDAQLPTDLVPDKEGKPRVDAMTLVARKKEGPFVPLLVALRSDDGLLAAFARALDLRSLKRARPLRTWMLAGLMPLLVVTELERELWVKGADVGMRMIADAFLFVALAVELLRPVPPRPRVVSVVFFAVGARYAFMILAAKGHNLSVMIWAAPLISIAAGALAFLLPSREGLAREVLAKLHVEIPDVKPEVDSRAIGRAVVAATGLPLALLAARKVGVSLWQQAGIFIVVGAIAAYFVSGSLRGALRRGYRATAESVVYGLVRTFGLAGLAHHVAGSLGEIWKMISAESFARTGARFFEAETVESTRQVDAVKARLAFVAMTVIFGPIIEELIYRGGVQRTLRPRLGAMRATIMASLLFAMAHLGVYQAAMYQTVFLGIAFGLTLEEGGIVAAILVHALWNLYLLV